ncbi:hypothetical protein N9T15_00600 [Pelagibacteraceae bacterium]|nr:hypothetical protein [Pelagibacteraceae bacterium]
MEQLIKKDKIQKLLADYMFTATNLLKENKTIQAIKVLKAGASYGHPAATLLLADLYDKGEEKGEVLKVSPEFSAKWYLKGCHLGVVDAMVVIVDRLIEGKGINQDVVQAGSWALIAGEYYSEDIKEWSKKWVTSLESILDEHNIKYMKLRAQNLRILLPTTLIAINPNL